MIKEKLNSLIPCKECLILPRCKTKPLFIDVVRACCLLRNYIREEEFLSGKLKTEREKSRIRKVCEEIGFVKSYYSKNVSTLHELFKIIDKGLVENDLTKLKGET